MQTELVNKRRERESKIIMEKGNGNDKMGKYHISRVFLYHKNIMKKFMSINLQIQIKLTTFQTNMLAKLHEKEMIIIK